ncbi:Syntaxin [Rhynchospora pubera]|uniref:Syntaxin n=1 Tax=Rhynchospora pubera TaxID=906938 RepID=A0AAV8DJU1_9POAL|nr:Syntaxin [Rhynchospora pubera]
MNDLMTDSFVGVAKNQINQDLESGPSDGSTSSDPNPNPSVNLFLSQAEAAKQEMLSIQALLSQLNRENEARKSELTREALRSLSARINDDMVKTVRKARGVRARLQSMDRRVDPKDRARVSVVRGLSGKLREIMGEFQGLRQRMVEENREAVARCYFTITGENPSEEVVQGIISSGCHAPELLVQKAIAEGDQAIASVVQEMEDRQESAREVERGLLELQQLFLDMSVLVESQGKQIEKIEEQVDNAGQDINAAKVQLEKAKVQQTSARKTWLWIVLVVLVLIVLAVVAGVVWFSLRNKNSGLQSAVGLIKDFVLD